MLAAAIALSCLAATHAGAQEARDERPAGTKGQEFIHYGALARLARQLAVEALQMGASSDLVLRVVRDELEALKRERSRD